MLVLLGLVRGPEYFVLGVGEFEDSAIGDSEMAEGGLFFGVLDGRGRDEAFWGLRSGWGSGNVSCLFQAFYSGR